MCKVACGNGVRDSKENEGCDDGNTSPNDGCDSSCKKENGFVCFGGSDLTIDFCHRQPVVSFY